MKKAGWILIIVLALIPVLIWLGIEPINARFTNFTQTMTNLGRIFALVGVSLFSLTFLLNTRLKLVENLFGGLDKTYKAHHICGATAFLFVLFHPIFLSIQYILISANLAAQFFLPSLDKIDVSAGIVALLLMTILLVITFFVKLKYPNWKFSHKFLGLAFIFAILHVLLISSDISRSGALKTYIVLMLIIGITSFSYKTLFYGLKKKSVFVVEQVKKINQNIVEICLAPKNHFGVFKPGQFIFASFKDKEIGEEYHPFTISSSPSEEQLRLTIKESGDYTEKLKNLKPQTKTLIEGPYGGFYSKKEGEQIWIAGGIGITPFLSMARSIKTNNKIDLFYTVKEKKDAVFIEELQKISKQKNNFTVHAYYSSLQGRMIAKNITEHTKNIENKEIFLCGPAQMMLDLKKQLISLGANRNNIYFEEFGLL